MPKAEFALWVSDAVRRHWKMETCPGLLLKFPVIASLDAVHASVIISHSGDAVQFRLLVQY